MSLLLTLPLLVPLTGAVLCVLLFRSPGAQRAVALGVSLAHCLAAAALFSGVRGGGVAAVQISGWPAPFGITFVADLLAAVMVCAGAGMGLCIVAYSLFAIDRGRERFGYYPLVLALLAAVCGAFLTGDIFNLYVWFEVMLMASFALMALGGERPQLEGAIKYVTLNLVSSAVFLSGAGILYGRVGTLNLADLSLAVDTHLSPGLLTAIAMLFLVAFGIKAALFPFFFWLPASYHTPPTVVAALFSALLTKVGAYALIRVFTLVFSHDIGWTHPVILALAGVTMLTGVLGAASKYDFPKILAFHIVSQIGYIVMGLGLFSVMGLAGAVYFMVHNIVVKTNLFLVAGIARRLTGETHLDRLGGLCRARPWLAACFFVSAMSLAGLPPFSGFFGKLALLVAAARTGHWTVFTVAVVVSFLTLYSMTKIWTHAFWKPAPEGMPDPAPGRDPETDRAVAGMLIPVTALAAVSLLMGLGAGPCMRLALDAAEQLLDKGAYIRAVLGEGAA